MESRLDTLREILLRGVKLSMQGSHARREPHEDARGELEQARKGLRAYVAQDSSNTDAWRLLAQAEECLLHYREAIDCLERAMELSGTRSRNDVKKLAALRERMSEWNRLPLTPAELKSLGEYLVRAGVEDEVSGRSLIFTECWLAENGFDDPEAVLGALAERGGQTDFMILYNLVRG